MLVIVLYIHPFKSRIKLITIGLSAEDRAKIELLFLNGQIKILCATSTLAHGVNLPAHLVIIKGFQILICFMF